MGSHYTVTKDLYLYIRAWRWLYNKSKHVAHTVHKYNKYRCVRPSSILSMHSFCVFHRIRTVSTDYLRRKLSSLYYVWTWTLCYVKFDILLHIRRSSEGLTGEDSSLRECEIVLCKIKPQHSFKMAGNANSPSPRHIPIPESSTVLLFKPPTLV
jgi:hypothetical protein